MRIVALASRRATWRLDGSGSARGRHTRAALLLELRTERGAIGLGEAAPLAGTSLDTLDDAARAVSALAARLPFDCTDDASSLAAELPLAPAVRFAIETALLSALAAERNISLASLLAGRPLHGVPLAVVVDTPAEAARAFADGVGCLKIKVGAYDFRADLDRLRAIARAAPGARLRLDANRTWPRDVVHEWLGALSDLPIDYVEEPCADAHLLLATQLACPIALDESLAMLAPDVLDAALRSRSLAALVLKPTLLGGLHACLELARRARGAGVAAIVSHSLEGPIGTAACAELALAIGGEHAAGLAPHPALVAWALKPPQLTTLEIRDGCSSGLGLGALELDAVLATLDRPLSVTAAARQLPERTAIITATSSMAYTAVSRTVADRPRVAIATPSVETVTQVYAALDDEVPIALLHPALPAAELARQRELVANARLPADAAVVLFTSGSMGAARGVVLSREALLAAAEASAAHLGWLDDDRWLVALSLAHAGGLAVVVRCLVARKPIVLAAAFDRGPLVALLERSTLASLVPTQLAALLDDPAWRPPARLRALLLGGAAASPALLEAAAARGVPFLTTYGMTESFGQLATAPLVHAGDPHAPLVPLAGVELAGGTRALPAPIRVRAPMLATCYLDGAPIAPELITADLGFVDGAGLHVLGRADDVIVTGGENVHPATVEAVLDATPGVRAACAFGIADERWGQIVGAAIAVDDRFDTAALRAWHAALPAYALPRELAVVRELPVLASGKVDRRAASRLPRESVRYPR